jgi:class 3 adenylate cyclase
MDTMQRSNRTWLCTVVFLDIVEYSRKPVAQQFAMKEQLNSFISRAIEHVSDHDRIILDTGDGAALCFMGDPEDALFAALNLRDAIVTQEHKDSSSLAVRIGINLGPAKMVKDINRQLNIIGDGINVAQRMMNFAEPNQILVSRSFFEVISCLSQEHARLFHYRGLRKDKHIREHAVYEVALLGNDHMAVEAAPNAEPDPTTNVKSVVESRETQPPQLTPAWEAAWLQTAQHHLALYVGPVARLLVQQTVRKTADIQEFYRLLAENIADERERDLFLKAVSSSHQSREQASTPSPPPEADSRWPAEVLSQAEVLLAQYLGPVAKVLVQREAKRAQDTTELYSLLAEHLSADGEKQRFMRDAALQEDAARHTLPGSTHSCRGKV